MQNLNEVENNLRLKIAKCATEVRRLQSETEAADMRWMLSEEGPKEVECAVALQRIKERLEDAENDQYHISCVYAVALRKRGLTFEQAAKAFDGLDNAAGCFEVALNLAFDPELDIKSYDPFFG